MARIDIMFSRFSAFYSPLISTISAGFLKEEGLEASYSVATPERTVRDAPLLRIAASPRPVAPATP